MKKVIKSIIMLLTIAGINSFIILPVIGETISGTISYTGVTSTGTFWVWASTAPLGQEGSDPVALSSYTAKGNSISFQYTLVINPMLLPRQFYIYAVRDFNPPYVEEYLQNPQAGINPIYGDPLGELVDGVYLYPGQNPTGKNFQVYDLPQGKISGTIYYTGTMPQNPILHIAVGRKEGDWIGTPIDYKGIQNPTFPVAYELNFLPDATDYYVVAVLDDGDPDTHDPFAINGPITISGGNWVRNFDFTLARAGISGTIQYDGALSGIVWVKILDSAGNPVAGTQVYFTPPSAYYTILDIPQGIYYILAFMDLNNNNIADTQEPSSGLIPVFLGGRVIKDITLNDVLQVSTITITLRGKVVDSTGSPLGGATVELIDTGGFNDYNIYNDRVIATTTSSSTFSGSGYELYNFEFPNVNVAISDQARYAYRIVARTQGYRKNEIETTFYGYQANQTVYIYPDLYLYERPNVTIENFTITPSTITPNNDGIDDQAEVKFTYKVLTPTPSLEISAVVKFVVDSNKNGIFDPQDTSIFVWDNQNRIWKKKDPNYYVDWRNPDYSKLEGPLTYEDYKRIVSSSDTVVSWYISGTDLNSGNGYVYKEVSFLFNGRNEVGQLCKNGTFDVQLQVYDITGEFITSVEGQISVRTPSITGVVKDNKGNPIEGAKVSVTSISGWSEGYTDKDGNFEVPGLIEGTNYHMEIVKDGYVQKTLDNVQVGQQLNIVLEKGVEITGNIILPDPPKRGDVRDSYGNIIYDLYCTIEAQNLTGPGWSMKNVIIHLPEATQSVSITSAAYTLYLSPNSKYRLVAKAPRYVAKEVIVDISTQPKNVNLELTKAVEIKGVVKLPSTIDENLYSLIQYGFGINVWANSKDGKYHSGTFVSFSGYEVTPGSSKTFIIDSIVPNTSYYVGIDVPNLVRKQVEVWVGGVTKVLDVPFVLEPGARIVGKIKGSGEVYARVKDELRQDVSGRLGMGVGIELTSLRNFTKTYHHIFISSDVISGSQEAEFNILGLDQGVTYRIHIYPQIDVALEVTPQDFEVKTSTVDKITQLPEVINIVLPTGVVKGKLKDTTGKVDFSKVQLQLVMFGKSGGGIAVVNPSGEFMFTGLPSGMGLIWGCEYSTKPFTLSPNDYFGIGTGNVGMFGKTFYSVHGSTVDLGEIELKPAGEIRVEVKATPELIDTIYAGVTTYLDWIKTGQVDPEGPYGFIRVQPKWLGSLYDYIKQDDPHFDMLPEELSIGIDETIIKQDSTTVVFKFNSAEEGLVNIFPMVGSRPFLRWSPKDEYELHREYVSDIAVYPYQATVIVLPNRVSTVTFIVSEGVEILGSVTRDPSSIGKEEIIKAYLKDLNSQKTYAEYDILFDSTTKYQTTQLFKFSRVPPGRYLLVIWSTNYKVYSKEINVAGESITLSPIQLQKGANIVFRIVDETGSGVVSGIVAECVAVPFVEGSYRSTEMEGIRISTDVFNSGRVRFTNLPKGNYVIKISNRKDSNTNYVTTIKAGISVPDAQVDIDLGNIVLKQGVEVTGQVLSPQGTPLKGVTVGIYPQDIQLRSGMEIYTVTDQEGKFRFRGVNPSIKYWEIIANPYSEEAARVSPELAKKVKRYEEYAEGIKSYINVQQEQYRRNIVIQLVIADAELTGQVKTQDGGVLMLPFEVPGIDIKDLQSAVVLLQSEKDVTSGDPLKGAKVLTRPDGRFEIKGITSGKYKLKVFSRGYRPAVVDVEVKSGQNDVGVVTLEKGVRISGTIRTPKGEKIPRNLAIAVVASDKKFADMIIGYVEYNPVTLEVERYVIDGLKQGGTYYLTIVPEGGVYIVTDPQPVVIVSTDTVRDIVYRRPRPYFEVKSYKFKDIIKEYISNWLTFFESQDLTILTTMPQDTWAKHLMIAQLIKRKNVDLAELPDTFDIYIILGFISQPVKAEVVEEIVSTVTALGKFIPLGITDAKNQFVVGYIPALIESTTGYFELKFSAVNYYDVKGEETYRFYLGEDAKAEKVITPLVGGYVTVGENDDSALEVLPGTEFEGIDVSSETKIVITKYTTETIQAAPKMSPKMFSTPLPSPSSYPGEPISAIYDMEIKLINGPLATLAKGNKVKLTIAISSSAVKPQEVDLYKLCYYNESTKKWEIEDVPLVIDFDKYLAIAEVNHLSKFAIFKVVVSTLQPYSGEFNAYVYPNPIKNVDKFNVRVNLPGSGKVKAEIKFYNIAGELVRSIEQQLDAGYINDIKDIELTNDKGEKLASGVYILYIKVGEYKKLRKFAVIR